MNGWRFEAGEFNHVMEYEQWLNEFGAQGYALLHFHVLPPDSGNNYARIIATMGKQVVVQPVAQTQSADSLEVTFLPGSRSAEEQVEQHQRTTPPPEVIPVRETDARFSPPRNEPGRYG